MRSTDKIIKFILVFSIVMVIRYIGIENIPYCVILFIILSGILYFVWSIFRIRKSKNKDKYYIIFALNLIAFSISIFF
ncbi:hypothetical protein AGR56_18315 [Clostridium sp. DMHC 10]|nr:hypothetical protein [Clostridium sp. DMHC 10]KOF55767.1 hypothetical protein AGR56_18315 [Clostridium sp. DMHC 10]